MSVNSLDEHFGTDVKSLPARLESFFWKDEWSDGSEIAGVSGNVRGSNPLCSRLSRYLSDLASAQRGNNYEKAVDRVKI